MLIGGSALSVIDALIKRPGRRRKRALWAWAEQTAQRRRKHLVVACQVTKRRPVAHALLCLIGDVGKPKAGPNELHSLGLVNVPEVRSRRASPLSGEDS